jgi:hypothetical protein
MIVIRWPFFKKRKQISELLIIKSTIFWDITPRTPLSVNRLFGGTYRLHLQGRKNKSVDTQRTTRRYIPKDGTIHNHRCENLDSSLLVTFLQNKIGSNSIKIMHAPLM